MSNRDRAPTWIVSGWVSAQGRWDTRRFPTQCAARRFRRQAKLVRGWECVCQYIVRNVKGSV